MNLKKYYSLKSFPNAFFLGFWLALLVNNLALAQKIDMEKLKDMKPRAIGPAGMSGRVTAIDVVIDNPEVIYLGTASGGLWKSESGGIDWKPIFDKEKVLAIGAVAIVQSNPDVIWVGTGEGNPRNSQSSGSGVYKSMDGGKTWKLMGLEKSRTIHRILIHPQNPDIVYVGVQGSAWGNHPERGLYKTTDGGKTWKQILFNNEKSGVAEMVMDPKNPNKLLVAMWEFQRQPWFFKSGGEGSGLYITYDGGESWTKKTDKDGLPKGELGKMGLAIARNNPNIVYAIVEAKKNGFYRSEDGGSKWSLVNDKGGFGDRPFYYYEIYVDPNNENRIYSLYSVVSISEDGGKNWRVILPGYNAKGIHPDHHAWWIHPKNSNFMIDGNDGGAAITRDMGKSWQFIENLPVAQYYHINVDMETPYNIYGGMQDNGSWRGPAYVWRNGGIRNEYFEELSFGDGFDVVPDVSDSRYGFSMSQQGFLVRYDLESGKTKLLKPVHLEAINLRFNWNAAIAQDPFDKKTIYYGSQFVHKSSDRGENWTVISPDLTTNDKEKQKQGESGGLTYDATGAENHTTIITIAPSPVQEGLIWVGTDDGNLQLTQDGGKSWKNLIENIKGVPKNSWIPQIQASKYNAGEAFVIINNYRRNDWTPYLFQTKDYGKTWKRLVDESKVWGYTLCMVQDPVEPKLLFLGTEFGLYVSIDGGDNWTQWTNEYPNVSTYDMVIHPREHDLVIGTFGRSAFVLDDIRPLRELAQKGSNLLDKPLHVFQTPEAVLANIRQPAGGRFVGHTPYQGDNRPFGVMLSFSVKELKSKAKKEEPKDKTVSSNPNTKEISISSDKNTKKESILTDTMKVKIEILEGNEVIRTLELSPKVGINRVQWTLNRKGVRFPNVPKPKADAPEPGGMAVLPGTYLVRMTYGTDKDSTTIKVIADPRLKYSESDIKASYDLAKGLMKKIDLSTQAVWRLEEAKNILGIINKELNETKEENEGIKNLKKQGKVIEDTIKVLRELIIGKENMQGIFRSSETLSAMLGQTSGYIQGSLEAPNSNQKAILEQSEKKLSLVLNKVNQFFEKDWKSYQKAVEDSKFTLFKSYQPLKLD